MAFIVKTFGIENIRRDQVIARGPRFHIGFDANAADKVTQTTHQIKATKAELTTNQGLRSFGSGPAASSLFRREETEIPNRNPLYNSPQSNGRYEMMRCKVDSVSLGVMPGRRVAAVRWEGVSEGITYHLESIQTFKNNLTVGGTGPGSDPVRVPSTSQAIRR